MVKGANVVFLGSGFSGKTTIIVKVATGEFNPDIDFTCSDYITNKKIALGNHCINLELLDTPGSEYYRFHSQILCRGANVVLFVFSLGNADSFEDLNEWVKAVEPDVDNMPILFVVGNKNDLVEERKVESEQAELFAKEIGAFYYEVSAKTGSGIEELFNRVAEESYNKLIHENNEQPSINLSNNDSHNNSKCT